MKLRQLIICLFFILGSNFVMAQHFQTSGGVRLGSGAGISVKHLASEYGAFVGILMYRRGGVRLIGLAKAQTEIGRSNTFIFAGIGGHVGVNSLVNPESPTYRVAGFDAILGVEYLFPGENMIFSLDLKPMVEVLQGWRFSGNSGAVSLRFPID